MKGVYRQRPHAKTQRREGRKEKSRREEDGFLLKVIKLAAVFILLSVIAASLPAQTEHGATGSGDNLTIKIAVMGPGDELYFWWGHIALVIDDNLTEKSRFYDYGIFTFGSEDFFVNFAFGRLFYSSGVSSASGYYSMYKNTNRDITLYTLDIPPEKRAEINQFAETSVLPENRLYLYHHFKKNCTGPILEVLDMATDGQFKKYYNDEPGRFTLRQHVRRHTWFSPFFDWILNFWMGQDIDTPITVWQEMFVPSEIAKRICEFNYIDSYGLLHPLVSEVEEVWRAYDRPPVLDTPRRQWPQAFAFGLFMALVLGALFFLQQRRPALGQVTLGVIHSLFGIVFGGAGLVLFFLSLFTDHDYTYHNANLLFCNPLMLAAIPLGILYAKSPNYYRRLPAEFLLRLLWLLCALGIFASMLIKLLPQFWQQNLVDQLLMLPIALVISLEPVGLKRMLRRIFWRWL